MQIIRLKYGDMGDAHIEFDETKKDGKTKRRERRARQRKGK